MTTYYEKRGRRYVPVAEYDAMGAIPFGTHIVSITPTGQRWQYNVEPARTAVEVALLEAQEAMETAMHQAMLVRPRLDDNPRMARAWAAYCKAYGGTPPAIRCEGVSARSVVEAGIAVLRGGL